MSEPAAMNAEAVEAWDGVLFDRFVQFREAMARCLAPFGDRALELHPPAVGERVLDIGCGFGDMTQQLAGLVGPDGFAVGIDAASRFIETAAAEAAEASVSNVEFRVGDVQVEPLEAAGFDAAYARFGTMFFANPVVAMRNVREALVPGGRLCMVVWRRKLDNEWVHRSEQVAERYLTHPEQTDEPTCGPGPFSMANADTVSEVLTHAGFEDVALQRCDMLMWLGSDVGAAADLAMSLGPAGELIRVNGADAEPYRERIEAEIREAMGEWAQADGVHGPASVWIVTAVKAAA